MGWEVDEDEVEMTKSCFGEEDFYRFVVWYSMKRQETVSEGYAVFGVRLALVSWNLQNLGCAMVNLCCASYLNPVIFRRIFKFSVWVLSCGVCICSAKALLRKVKRYIYIYMYVLSVSLSDTKSILFNFDFEHKNAQVYSLLSFTRTSQNQRRLLFAARVG